MMSRDSNDDAGGKTKDNNCVYGEKTTFWFVIVHVLLPQFSPFYSFPTTWYKKERELIKNN